MLPTAARRFDLYDLFSIFVPGTTVVGLLPFLPEGTALGTGLVGATVLLGFAVGRGVHTAAIWLRELLDLSTHREQFYDELDGPDHTSEALVSAFLDAFEDTYDIHLERTGGGADPNLLADGTHPDGGGVDHSLYTLVRSYIHMDSRGRSRTFQAIYALHRSMGLATLVLTVIYAGYGLLDALGVLAGSVNYTSYVGSLGLSPLLLICLPILVGSASFSVSRRGMRVHGRYYVQYLISDFVTLYEAEERVDSGDPTTDPPRVAR